MSSPLQQPARPLILPVTTKRSHVASPLLLRSTIEAYATVASWYNLRNLTLTAGGYSDILKVTELGEDTRVTPIWSTGGGLQWADTELMVKLSHVLPRPPAIFGVGNAFGLSTLVMACLWPSATIDVIDAGFLGNGHGSRLTNGIAKQQHRDVRIFTGWSPKDVTRAMRRAGEYEFAFIDGVHTGLSLGKDLNATLPHMAGRGRPKIVMCHDVGVQEPRFRLIETIAETLERLSTSTEEAWDYVQYRGENWVNTMGTGFFFSGFDDAAAKKLRSLGKAGGAFLVEALKPPPNVSKARLSVAMKDVRAMLSELPLRSPRQVT